MKQPILILFLLLFNTLQSQVSNESIEFQRTIVQTEFGRLAIIQSCTKKHSALSFNYFYSYLEDKIDEESEIKKIETDTVIVELQINKNGYISKSKIIKEGLLQEFTSFVKNIIIVLREERIKPLKCNMKAGKYKFPVRYKHNKSYP